RKPELGIARAVGFLRRDLLTAFALEGTFYAIVAAALGALAGLGLGYVMIYFFDRLVPHGDVVVTFHFNPTSVITAFVAGIALTLASVFNLAWILTPVGLLNQRTDNVSVAFVMTGIILVGSGILIAVFNVSEVLRALLRRASRGAGRPVLTTAVSYPTEKRFRTGMTVAMFALILFMVTLISMVQGLQASSLDTFVRQQSGGYDVIAYTTSYGEIP